MSFDGNQQEPLNLPELHQKIAEGVSAMVDLGLHYLNEQEFDQAACYLQAAANFEHPDAIYYLAQMHLNGDGVEQNNELAVEMLIHLAQQHLNGQGMYPAEELLKKVWARGICRDRIDAFYRDIYERSLILAEDGHDVAMVQAALLLMTVLAQGEKPSPEDTEKARQLLTEAASLGNENAHMLLRQFGDS